MLHESQAAKETLHWYYGLVVAILPVVSCLKKDPILEHTENYLL